MLQAPISPTCFLTSSSPLCIPLRNNWPGKDRSVGTLPRWGGRTDGKGTILYHHLCSHPDIFGLTCCSPPQVTQDHKSPPSDTTLSFPSNTLQCWSTNTKNGLCLFWPESGFVFCKCCKRQQLPERNQPGWLRAGSDTCQSATSRSMQRFCRLLCSLDPPCTQLGKKKKKIPFQNVDCLVYSQTACLLWRG